MKLLINKIDISRIPKWLPILIIAIALIGFSDALYLTVVHYLDILPPCTIAGCEKVLTSKYSTFYGIPVALFGAIYYLFIILSGIVYLDSKKEIYLRLSMILSILGFLFSLWFVSVMVFIIESFCQYCLLSALSSTTIFILSYYFLLKSQYLSRTVREQL